MAGAGVARGAPSPLGFVPPPRAPSPGGPAARPRQAGASPGVLQGYRRLVYGVRIPSAHAVIFLVTIFAVFTSPEYL